MSKPLAIVGGGSWGTALALHAARRWETVRLWIHDPELERSVRRERVNATYLPGHRLPENVVTSAAVPEVVEGAGTILFAVPSHHLRGVVQQAASGIPAEAAVLVATKGLEVETLLRMSEVVASAARLPVTRIAVLSGPSFAVELAAGHPTAVVVATEEEALARRLQGELSFGSLRIYRNADRIGVELGGALKNVIALAAGILEGLGYGSNTAAALLTRGLHEMTRLAVSLGGERATLAGLAGIGDLVLTCTGKLSRNRAVGVEVGRGRRLEEVLGGMKMVAEGVRAAAGAVGLARRQGVETPIAERVHAILFEAVPPREAVGDLLARELKDERTL